MFTFRTSLTFAVMAFVVALAVLLIAIQVRSLRWATHEAASAYMRSMGPSAKALGRLRTEIATMASLVHVLATSSSVANSMKEPRPAVRSRYSKPHCKNCLKWTAYMQVSKTALGCRYGALTISTTSSAEGCVRRLTLILRSIWSAPRPVAICRATNFRRSAGQPGRAA